MFTTLWNSEDERYILRKYNKKIPSAIQWCYSLIIYGIWSIRFKGMAHFAVKNGWHGIPMLQGHSRSETHVSGGSKEIQHNILLLRK